MTFRLRYKMRELVLSEGELVIGRSGDCQLSLDDPLVSRTHAVVTVRGEEITVEDKGSRNGVRVNGKKIAGSRIITHGDCISIGNQEILVIREREQRVDTLAQQPTQRVETLGVLSTLADKAIVLGRPEEAERLLTVHLQQIFQEARSGYTGDLDTAERAARYGVKLAAITGKSSWLEYVFELFSALSKPCPADVVDDLYTVMRKVRLANSGVLRRYLNILRGMAAETGPAERFLIGRIEGLGRLAGLK